MTGTNLKENVFELNAYTLQTPTMTFDELENQVDGLNKYIGDCPPRLANEEEREVIYKKWLSLVSEAEMYDSESPGVLHYINMRLRKLNV